MVMGWLLMSIMAMLLVEAGSFKLINGGSLVSSRESFFMRDSELVELLLVSKDAITWSVNSFVYP